MKRFLIAAVLAAASLATHASAVWNIDLVNYYGSDPVFSLTGTFTTADANINRGTGELITSFNAVVSDPYETNAQVTLVPPGQTVAAGPGLVYTYDDLFFGPTDLAAGWSTGDAFNDNGVLLSTSVSSINLFSPGIVIGDIYSPSNDTQFSLAIINEFLDGSITFAGFTSTVDEQQTSSAMLAGGLLILLMRRKRAR